MIVPQCLYVAGVTNYRKEYIRKMETRQSSMGKWCYRAPKNTARDHQIKNGLEYVYRDDREREITCFSSRMIICFESTREKGLST